MTTGIAITAAAAARPGSWRARTDRWRAGTLAAAGTIPVIAMSAHAILAGSEGHHPASCRPAIPIRVYESGSGGSRHAAPARHPHPPRPPPWCVVTHWGRGDPAGPPLRGQGCRASLTRRPCGPAWTPEPLWPLAAGTKGQASDLPRYPPQPRWLTTRSVARPAAGTESGHEPRDSTSPEPQTRPEEPQQKTSARLTRCEDLTSRFI